MKMSKKSAGFILSFGLLFLLVGTPYRVVADDKEWVIVAPENEGFSISMPDTPRANKTDDGSPDWELFDLPYAYMVIVNTDPSPIEATDEEVLEKASLNFTAGTKGELKSKTTINIQGYPGRDLVIRARFGMVKCRMVLVGRHFYMVTLITTDNVHLSAPNVQKYFASFKIITDKKDQQIK